MTDAEQKELVATLNRQAQRAHLLAGLYEEAAETVAGFRTEEEYQDLAREAFETNQAQIDDDASCRKDGDFEEALR
jgi:hypothetical protein